MIPAHIGILTRLVTPRHGDARPGVTTRCNTMPQRVTKCRDVIRNTLPQPLPRAPTLPAPLYPSNPAEFHLPFPRFQNSTQKGQGRGNNQKQRGEGKPHAGEGPALDVTSRITSHHPVTHHTTASHRRIISVTAPVTPHNPMSPAQFPPYF